MLADPQKRKPEFLKPMTGIQIEIAQQLSITETPEHDSQSKEPQFQEKHGPEESK